MGNKEYYVKSIKGFGSRKYNGSENYLNPILIMSNTTEREMRKEVMNLIKAHPTSEFIVYTEKKSQNGKIRFMDQFWVHWDKESNKPIMEFYYNEWKPGYKYDMSKPKSKRKKEIRGFDPYMYLMTKGKVGYNDYKKKKM